MFVCFSLRDKYFCQKPVLIALVPHCLNRVFIWKQLSYLSLQLHKSYRRLKPSELSILGCRAQGVQPWQTLSPAKRHQCHSMPQLISSWTPLTSKPARPTQKVLKDKHGLQFSKDYSYTCLLLCVFLLHFTMAMWIWSNILITLLTLVRAKSVWNSTELLPPETQDGLPQPSHLKQ